MVCEPSAWRLFPVVLHGAHWLVGDWRMLSQTPEVTVWFPASFPEGPHRNPEAPRSQGNWCPQHSRFLQEWAASENQVSLGFYSPRAAWGMLFTSSFCTPFSTVPHAGMLPRALLPCNPKRRTLGHL